MRTLAAGLMAGLLALAGCRTAEPATGYAPTWAKFYLESTDPSAPVVTLPRSGVRVTIGAQPVLGENDIVNVEMMQVELGKCLMFQVTPGAARDLYRLSASNQGRRLVLTLNNAPFGARRIDGPLADGTVLIFVEVPDETLRTLVDDLKQSSAALQRALAKK